MTATGVQPLTFDAYATLARDAAAEVFGLEPGHPALEEAVTRAHARLARHELDARALAAADAAIDPPAVVARERRTVDRSLYTVRRAGPARWLVRRDGRLEGPQLGPDHPTQRTALAFAVYLYSAAAHGPCAQTDEARHEYLALSTIDTKDA